ncbi:MAG TPA: GNAT family N-acetyltransferase [Crinalium sp.]|jgi:ribosomal protein S18 acetylase RimI-like enzyme
MSTFDVDPLTAAMTHQVSRSEDGGQNNSSAVQRYDKGVSNPASDRGEFVNPPSNTFPFLIRTARQNDLGTLTDVLANSFHAQDGPFGWLYPLLRMGIYEDLRARLRSQSPHHACLVAIRNGAVPDVMRKTVPTLAVSPGVSDPVAGTVEIGLRAQSLWQPRNQQHLYLSNLAVKQEYRRQGVARQLLLACERIALDWGYKDLYLHVLEDNLPARRLYLGSGYEVVNVESSLGHWLFGRPRQIFLHKRLL